MSLSAMVESALDTIVPTTVKEWDEVRTYRMAIAERLLVTAVATEKADTALSYIKEIMDRTEGKAMQRNQNTNLNVNIDVIAD